MSDKNILSLQKKEQLAEAVHMKKVRGKDKKVFGENSREKLSRIRSSHLEVLCKEVVLRNFTKFTRKYLCQSLVLINLLVVYYFRKSFIIDL